MGTENETKDLQYYLSKGFDPATAEYFAAGRRTIIDVKPAQGYRLELTFDNGEVRLYDVMPYLRTFTIYEPLKDPKLFSEVYLDERHCVSWDVAPGISCSAMWKPKIDLSTDACYLNSTLVYLK